jgi:hypothetical protein
LWLPPATLSTTSTASTTTSMVGFASMPFSIQTDRRGNQLRAEAAPYVPMNVGIGVQAC